MNCYRCGRNSHTAKNCYARTHLNGMDIENVNYVYSLNLKDGRKYIGKTNNIDRWMQEHFSGNGSKWTKKYNPTDINHVQACTSSENKARAETIVYHPTMGINSCAEIDTHLLGVLDVEENHTILQTTTMTEKKI